MSTTLRTLRHGALLIAASLLLIRTASAEGSAAEPPKLGVRKEVWVTTSSWPTLSDLQPAVGGSFNSIGYGLGAAAHWPVRQFGDRALLLGVEGEITATDSDIPVALDDLLARHAYVAISGKYVIGKSRSFSLDGGIALHLADIVQLESDYAVVEFESWEDSAIGAYVGATWEPGAARPDKRSGLSLGLKVHFVDFGSVRDEDIYSAPILGADAGDLAGPYHIQIGYRWR